MVYGAGAVGGVLGARLHEAGHDVVLVARGAHLEAIRSDGLTLATPEGSRTLPVPAVAGAADVDLAEPTVVLLAVRATRATPRCSTSSAPGILDVGRFPSGVDERAHSVADAFCSAGFVSEPRADIMAWKRRKLLMNLANAVQACCGSGEGADELRRRALAEGEAVLSAAGLSVVSEAEDRARRGDILQNREIPGRERGGGSSWQSLRRGTGTIESDYLNGEIVLLGRLHEVPTPCNELLRRTALSLARAGSPPGSVDAEDLLTRLAAS